MFLLTLFALGVAHAADAVRLLVSVANKGSQIQMARDLARQIGKSADLSINVVGVAGTPEALLRARDSSGLVLAFLQSDAALAYQLAAQRGRPEAQDLAGPMRVVAPLHAEDIYFVVRRESPMQTLDDLSGARINLGQMNGGSALTVTTLYRLLFDAPIPDTQARFLTTEDALVKLLTEDSLDAVAIVAPRPAKFLADMKPEAKRFVRLLRFDPTRSKTAQLAQAYATTRISPTDYPSLLDEDMTTLSVRIFLTASSPDERSDRLLSRFAGAWCRHLPTLAVGGPAQWRDIKPALSELPAGWHYARPAAREMRACVDGTPVARDECNDEDRVLGLCR